MARATKPVRHLLNRNGRYYARLVVPARLHPIVGKRELLEPLGAERGPAIIRLHEAIARFHKTLAAAEKGVSPLPKPVSLRHAVHARYAAELAEDDRFDEPARPNTRHFNQVFALAALSNLRRVAKGNIADGGFIEATIGWAIDRASEGKTRPKPGSKEYAELAKALASAQIEAMERVRERDGGDYDGKPSYRLLREPENAKEPISIEGLLDRYLAMLAKTGRGEGASKRWRPCFRNLVAFVKHDDANLITKGDLNRWVEHLRETLAEKTIKDVYLGSMKAVLGYAVEQDIIGNNPASAVKVRLGRREQVRDKGFTPAESVTILRASRHYEPKHSDNPQTRESEAMVAAKRWAPMLCAFTGARISEITQLRKEDVRRQDGIDYLRLTPDAGSIKTRQFRDVPLHPQLISEGFLDFVAQSPDGPLFFRRREGGNQRRIRAGQSRVASRNGLERLM